jgi:hypothetical protein
MLSVAANVAALAQGLALSCCRNIGFFPNTSYSFFILTL